MASNNNIKTYISQNLKSLECMSAPNGMSNSDVWKLDLIKGSYCLKYHISPESITPTNFIRYNKSEHIDLITDSQSLDYEIRVYKLVQEILDNLICPHFVPYIGSDQFTYEEISNLIRVHNNNNNNNNELSISKYQLNRNIYSMRMPYDSCYSENTHIPKYSIFDKHENETHIYAISKIENLFCKYKYNAVITKFINPNSNGDLNIYDYINRIVINERTTDTQASILTPGIIDVIFQTAIACHSLSIAKISHNDTSAPRNIIVQEVDTENKKNMVAYIVNGQIYLSIQTHKVMIYDYDRSYSKKLGDNKLLQGSLSNFYSQSNELINNRDIIKIIYYLLSKARDLDKPYILDWIGGCMSTTYNKSNTKIDAKTNFWLSTFSAYNASNYLLREPIVNTWSKLEHKRKYEQDNNDHNPSISSEKYTWLSSTSQILENIVNSNLNHTIRKTDDIKDLIFINPKYIYVMSDNMYDENGNINIENINAERAKYIPDAYEFSK
jgi:hypothetical protein